MSFNEICIYQVKPEKAEEFETIMSEAKNFLEKQEGLPPLKITRIVKSV